ncbi:MULTISPECIES: PTS fructose transporter subunit IIC [Glycomyces]|uniref:Fructose-specific PTS transporter subunit EIIC n=2 Tax=Glycomyces TaxID=58113 RepID=A0A9X3SUE7_9ACTN|nr:fructose-specific PTS transporter subunit EIIC [Glycomyces lechevalierae]MDA1383537.1 fructose-specific PTS transporter subunit EIIC [Glycomyces lechevalierae]MDR7341474.1 PTS system fructose-specific IIC component [Glycomyces lechevalierae]
MKLVAVTSCPTGIAHTYMAAEALEQAAVAAGHEIQVETQGAAGAEALDPAVIAEADAVIFAADVDVRDKDRFAGKPLVSGPVKRGINHAAEMVDEAVAKAQAAPASDTAAAVPAAPAGPKLGPGAKLRLWLMTGVSYMLPFVAAGGILIALAFVIGGAEIATKVNGGAFEGVTYEAITDPTQILNQTGIAGLMFYIGGLAFSMLVPILAGFIAFGMADRMGIAPGVVGGLIAVAVGAGFLGGLAAGLLAGAIVMALKLIKANQAFQGIMRIVVIPLVSVFVVGFIMLVVVGKPIAEAQSWLTDWLAGLSGVNAVLLGLLLGAMMGFDLGGPVNKVAYLFGVGALASGDYTVMAAVMAAGMVPPLGLALATVVRGKLFTQAERQSGKAAWLLGASFITEGAIPFAAADPLRVIPSTVIGGAVAGAVSMAFGASLRAPHGGIWVIGLIGNPGGFIVALLAGTAATCLCAIALKTAWRSEAASAADEAAMPVI